MPALSIAAVVLMLALSGASSPASSPAALTADLDGTGRALTATLRPSGKAARLEITGDRGKRLAAADAPAPGSTFSVRLASGALGSVGTLLEAVAAGPEEECRSFWRFRDGVLARLPARRGSPSLPDCGRPDGWKSAWEKKAADAPAVWVRERERETPRGLHREREVYSFSGFSLDLDSARSSGEIAGVKIPLWNDGILYTPSALDILSSRFDLARFRATPRLRIRADRAEGIFALELTDPAGRLEAAVTGTARGIEANEIDLTLRTETGMASASVTVRGSIVIGAVVAGISPRWDGGYRPANQLATGALEIYARAEDELTSNFLTGLWASDRGEQLAINLAKGVLGAVEMRRSQLDVSLDPVPAGTDVLLVPRDGAAPVWALALKGVNGMVRIPVHCGTRNAGPWSCETAGPGEAFHRAGGRMNAR